MSNGQDPMWLKNKKPLLLILLLAISLLRVIYVAWGPFDLSPDEAHYWEWSRRPDLSYYSKGPGVAYVIWFFTRIFGVTELGVRFGAVLFSALASYTVFLLGRDALGSEKAGFYAAVLINITPIFAAGAVLMTTDVLLLFFWGLALYCVFTALKKNSASWWYAAGAAIGAGFLSKYTIVLLLPCILLYLIFSKDDRFWLKRKEPYFSALISLVIVTPVIYWNIFHGQVTIKHTMGQAHVNGGEFSIIGPLEFIVSQIGLITPFFFAAIVYGIWLCAKTGFKDTGDGRRGALLTFFASAPVFAFFVVMAFRGKVQANWALASYVAAYPASVWGFESLYERRADKRGLLKAVAVAGVALAAIITLLVHFPQVLFPLGGGRLLTMPPFNRVTGWTELGEKVSNVKAEMEREGKPVFIMSDTYQIASELAFYMKGNPVTFNVEVGTRRMNQYDFWPSFAGMTGDNAVYVKGGVVDKGEVVPAFERCGREVVAIHYGGNVPASRVIKEFTIFRCYGFKGMGKAQGPKTY
ncbi:MAG: glycosyltransferase family 39 protein [Deltaproteobacteria bacterium]|nr:glycosyltransferase family 39 protein [Deltaproteobacteria bacterium]